MEVLVDARATDVGANQVAEKVLGTKSMSPFLDIKSARLCPLAHAVPNFLLACIWETAESRAHGFRSHLHKGTPMDSASMDNLLSFHGECYVICISYD